VRNRITRHAWLVAALLALACLALTGCAHSHPEPGTVVMLIESSPLNLDPRIGTDAQSERIGELIFEGLVRRQDDFTLAPRLAESWQIPDPLTYVFHLRRDVRFHDGHPLTSADVKWTLDSLLTGKVRSAKTSAYRYVATIEAPDAQTLVLHLKEPYAALLWNLSDGAFGVVEQGTGQAPAAGSAALPVGTGPFRDQSEQPDREVVLVRNDDYWGERAHIARIRFKVVPDATTRALELRKGSADAEINALPADMLPVLERQPNLVLERSPGTAYQYLAMNLRDPILRDVRVRRAVARAINRAPIIESLWHGMARPANSVLPPQHWAYFAAAKSYDYDPAAAEHLLDEAGYPAQADGVRFHLAMKTSTDETTRLLSAVLQQQLRAVGIALDIRSYEFATFYADVTRGAFQLYSLRWVGGSNQDPDVFENVFDSASFAPKRANRGYYSNPEADRLIALGRRSVNIHTRTEAYHNLQALLNQDLPYIHLWWADNVVVHTRRLTGLTISPAGNYDFLRTVRLVE
jgi:peptide/nickel transport system substrate-binding protein